MYLHQHIAVAPMPTGPGTDLLEPQMSAAGKLLALEPLLEGVPASMLRRMSKAVRMGLGAGLPLLRRQKVDGIIIGTANGGMEDCIKFLNQIVDYEEGLLTPGNFVQSTPNAIAGQLSLITGNHGYNATHVHKGLAFENALMDAEMLVSEHPGSNFLVGGVDEISTYNYNIDYLAGWYDKDLDNQRLYEAGLPATIAGEGAAMFLVNDQPVGAVAAVRDIEMFHSSSVDTVRQRFEAFISRCSDEKMLLISGENGDIRHRSYYEAVEHLLPAATPVLRFKHLTGEYPTAVSFGLWLACLWAEKRILPQSSLKGGTLITGTEELILYNQYQGQQHSFIRVRVATEN
ncbi:beta-ketoacyl synthase chain length factor [Niabella terrae]